MLYTYTFGTAHFKSHGLLFKKLQDIALSIVNSVHKAEKEYGFVFCISLLFSILF
jgi:hypothetical protein